MAVKNIFYGEGDFGGRGGTATEVASGDAPDTPARSLSSKYIAEQAAIINSSESSIKVRAGAGTGKTTTLIGYSDARRDKRFLMLCFNKAIQMESETRFGANVTCRTGHSVAYGGENVGSMYKHKLAPYVKAVELRSSLGLPYLSASHAINTVTQYLCSADREIGEQHAIAAGVKPSMRRDAVRLAGQVWKAMIDPSDSRVSIVHDGYLKLFQLNGRKLGGYDCVLLDEAQDTNPVMADIVASFEGDKVYVGDRNQSIYAFRGASNAMDEFSAKEYPLMSSFRFGQDIADVANVILRYSLGENSGLTGLGRSGIDMPVGNRPYALLARTNGMLFQAAVDGLDNGRKVAIIGGPESLRLSMMMDAHNLLIGSADRIVNPVIKQFESFDEMETLADETDDSEMTSLCKAVRRYGRGVPGLISRIKNNCGSDPHNATLVLSTAHKAKGLEFDQVVLADDFKNPADEDGIDIQEANLLYVAATRAKHNLVLNNTLRDFIDKPVQNPVLKTALRNLRP